MYCIWLVGYGHFFRMSHKSVGIQPSSWCKAFLASPPSAPTSPFWSVPWILRGSRETTKHCREGRLSETRNVTFGFLYEEGALHFQTWRRRQIAFLTLKIAKNFPDASLIQKLCSVHCIACFKFVSAPAPHSLRYFTTVCRLNFWNSSYLRVIHFLLSPWSLQFASFPTVVGETGEWSTTPRTLQCSGANGTWHERFVGGTCYMGWVPRKLWLKTWAVVD